MTRPTLPNLFSLLIAAATVASLASAAGGQRVRSDVLPEAFEGVGITEHLDAPLPLDAKFVDATGRTVALGEYFNQDKPVVMAMVYYRCPMLCTLVVNGMTEALRQIDWDPGEEYQIVVVSFNPAEGPELSKRKKAAYLAEFGREGVGGGWHFLTGDQPAIDRLTRAIGFDYKWNDATKEFVHDSAIYVVTPDGRLSKYLYGVRYEPRTLRLSMVEASRGKIGSIGDKITLLCSHYDPVEGSYAASALMVMRLTAVPVGMGLLMAILVTVFLARRRRRLASGGAT